MIVAFPKVFHSPIDLAIRIHHNFSMTKFLTSQKLTLLFVFLSLCVHGYLTLHYFDFRMGGAGTSVCNINATFSCDTVTASAYSSLFGIPLSILGLVTHLVLGIFTLAGVYGAASERNKFYSFSLGIFIFLSSVVMGLITLTQIQAVCLFCLFAYILSLMTLVSAYLTYKSSKSDPVENIKKIFTLGEEGSSWAAICIVAILPVSWLLSDMIGSTYTENLGKMVDLNLQYWKEETVHTFDSNNALSKGASETQAKMTIVEFADFNCIHCKMAAPMIRSFVRARKDVRLIFKSFPLDGSCNPAITQSGGGTGCLLAKSVLCANQQNKGWEAHDWIYENFGKMNEAEVEKMAQMLQVDKDSFNKCLSSPETHQAILAQAEQGKNAKVSGTPSIFVNGRHLQSGNAFPVLEAAYNSL